MGSAGVLAPLPDAKTSFTPLLQTSTESMLVDLSEFQSLPEPMKLQRLYKPSGEQYILAARIQGPATTAYPDGAPKEEPKAESEEAAEPTSEEPKEEVKLPEHVTQSTQDINVLVVGDTDVLTDRMWVQVQNFFGQQITTAFADNGNFVFNTLDNMTGSTDLISIRSRGKFSRPFTKVEEIQRNASDKYREEERQLQQRLEETEKQLVELQQQKNDQGELNLNEEQKEAIANFQKEKISIRKKLRDVQHQLNKDIEALATTLKQINIGLMPLVVIVVGIFVALIRRKRRYSALA
jgi:ABC-type uncharacterized transport system involved in gliding motility auxiliary subunit